MPVKLGAIALGALLVASFVWTSAIPIRQMRIATSGLSRGYLDAGDISKMTAPYNFAQSEVRLFALFNALDRLPKENVVDILPQMMELGEVALTKPDNKARREQEMAIAYNDAFKTYKKEEYLALGEEHARKAMDLAPGRQSVAFILVENLTLQGRFDELPPIMDVARTAEPDSVLIDVFYLSYLAPNDIGGKLGIVEKLRDLYMGEDRGANDEGTTYTVESYSYNITYARRAKDGALLRVINDKEITYIRESYSNHIHYAYRAGDERLLRELFLQIIEIEKALREIVDFQAARGIIPKSIDTREATFMQALNVLDSRGLDAINLK